MTEKQIVYQSGAFWVADRDARFTVYRDGLTHAVADSAYPRTSDGLSLARARVDYLARRQTKV